MIRTQWYRSGNDIVVADLVMTLEHRYSSGTGVADLVLTGVMTQECRSDNDTVAADLVMTQGLQIWYLTQGLQI